MGIPSFYKFLDKLLIPQSSIKYLRKVSEYKPLNVYIDLPIIMFSGCILDNRKSVSEDNKNVVSTIYDEYLVAQTAFEILNSHILYLYKTFNINKIVCYIDGLRPNMKMFTSYNRTKPINIQLALKYLCESINDNLKEIELKNLIIGESENECFRRRDVNFPTLILTEDSDAFHICYKYTKQSDHDLVFIANKYFKVLYDMSNLNFNMPRLAFLILMMLKGSDFTDKIFTDTMVEAIGKVWMQSNINTKFRLDISTKYKEINRISQRYNEQEREVQFKNTSSSYESITLNRINYKEIMIIDNDQKELEGERNNTNHVRDKDDVMVFDKSLKYKVLSKYTNKTIIYRIPNIYAYGSVKEIVKLFIELLILLKIKKTHISFNWNSRRNNVKKYHNSNIKGWQLRTNTNVSIINAITWGVNYSTIGVFYKYYDDSIYHKYVLIEAPFNFYASILKCDNSIMKDSEITLSAFKRRFVNVRG